MTDTEFRTVERMEKYGGSFVQALAQCFWRADQKNFKKLKEVFRDYWVEYENWID